jgi:hypothetical protein
LGQVKAAPAQVLARAASVEEIDEVVCEGFDVQRFLVREDVAQL